MSRDTFREEICSEIAHLFREERLRRKLSLNALAAQAGLNRRTVTFLETKQRTPTIDTLLRLTDVLEIRLEDLIRKARKNASSKAQPKQRPG